MAAKNADSKRVGIITKPIGKAGLVPLSKLVRILYSIATSTYVVTGGDGMSLRREGDVRLLFAEIPYRYARNRFIRAVKHVYMQMRISSRILRIGRKVDSWIFFLDAHALVLPVLTAKLSGKRVIFALAASINKSGQAQNDPLNKILVASETLNFRLANQIVVYSPQLIAAWSLEKYKNKIVVAHEHFIDLSEFRIKSQVNQREQVIGYVGRFSEEKGILNFLRAIPEILKARTDLSFLIGGDGQLAGAVNAFIDTNGLRGKVALAGWISYDELPDFFNRLKLMIIPSYTEGLPNAMLEAMACGTPVLATPVGAIPDILQDGSTGFIMQNNDPKVISGSVLRALNHPDLEKIALRERQVIEKEFTFEAAIANYRRVLEKV
jgi:glycosyltransferase involved in cell wall biosynthesis